MFESGSGTASEAGVFVYQNGQVVLQFDGSGNDDLLGTNASYHGRWNGGICQMTIEKQRFIEARDSFLNSCSIDYAFPAGGAIPILTNAEAALLEAVQSWKPSDAELVRALVTNGDWNSWYSVTILGVRLIIHSVHESSREIFRLGVAVIISGAQKIDWRDTLRALSIVENCSARLGLSFESEILKAADATDLDNVHERICGYLSRSVDMRSIDVMGLKSIERDGKVQFEST